MALIRVSLDESGTHDGSPVITVGAAWAKPSVWKKWTSDWNVAKRPIQVHHSVDCHNRDGEWKGWTKKERDDYVKRILPVIAKHKIRGRVSGLDLNAYKESLSHRPGVIELFGDPYVACFQWAVTDICETLENEGHRRIAFIHEQNDKQEEAVRVFRRIEREFPDLAISITFAPKKEFVPLQCADVLAYEGNHGLRDTSAPPRKPMLVVDPTGNRIGYVMWSKQDMDIFARHACERFDQIRERNIRNILAISRRR